jgi:hypothetical protein
MVHMSSRLMCEQVKLLDYEESESLSLYVLPKYVLQVLLF